jgi:fructosamine-3-kinase
MSTRPPDPSGGRSDVQLGPEDNNEPLDADAAADHRIIPRPQAAPATGDWPADLPPPVREEPLDGGYIGRTARVTLADGRIVVVKRCPYPAFQEAEGLRALGAAGAPVPEVLGVGASILVLEHVSGQPDWPGLGRAVARLHRTTASRFGWPTANYHGRFPQDNTWSGSWPDFYVQRRVAPQLARADLPADLRARIEAACTGPLPALLRSGPPASLTHGDLWPGNMIDGRWLVDPAVSYADRELDLAYLSLSDTLPPEFMAAYHEEYPIDPDFEERRPALLLHKHLVNVRHFGERALPRLWTLLEHYGG